MIVALITDYERALLDNLREDAFARKIFQISAPLVYKIPKTEEGLKDYLTAEDYKWVNADQEKQMKIYKAEGYKLPCEFGKGRVKVLLEVVEENKMQKQGTQKRRKAERSDDDKGK